MTQIQQRVSLSGPDTEPEEPEYGSETESDNTSPRSVVWTNDVAMREIHDYLEDKIIDSETEVSNATVLGTWFIADNTLYLGLKLNIVNYFRLGALYTEHFGYIHEAWTDEDKERPYDIMQVESVNNDGFIEQRVILKTLWIRLIQRHWKNRYLSNQYSLKGLMSSYKNSNIYIQ